MIWLENNTPIQFEVRVRYGAKNTTQMLSRAMIDNRKDMDEAGKWNTGEHTSI